MEATEKEKNEEHAKFTEENTQLKATIKELETLRDNQSDTNAGLVNDLKMLRQEKAIADEKCMFNDKITNLKGDVFKFLKNCEAKMA